MKSRTKLIVVAIIVFAAAALFVAGLIILPDVIVMQVQADGSAGTTLPKLLGLLIPLALTGAFVGFYYKSGTAKHLLLSILGLILFGLTFFFNR